MTGSGAEARLGAFACSEMASFPPFNIIRHEIYHQIFMYTYHIYIISSFTTIYIYYSSIYIYLLIGNVILSDSIISSSRRAPTAPAFSHRLSLLPSAKKMGTSRAQNPAVPVPRRARSAASAVRPSRRQRPCSSGSSCRAHLGEAS